MTSIKCARCNLAKPPECFKWKNRNRGTRDCYCNPCRRAYSKEHYERNKLRYYARNERAKKRLATFIDLLKNRPCHDCGGSFPPCAMDFDHRDPTEKRQALSKFMKGLTSKRLILEEIAKCDLVCATCHRIRTCEKFHKHKHRP